MIDRLMRDVDERDGDDADHDRPRNHAPGIPDLVADVADVVVAQVVVDADARRRAQAEEEAEREVERARRKIESERGLKCSAPVTITASVVRIVRSTG